MDNNNHDNNYRCGWYKYAWAALNALADRVADDERELVSRLLISMVSKNNNDMNKLMGEFGNKFIIITEGQRAVVELFHIEWETPTSKRKIDILENEALIALEGFPDNVLVAVTKMIREDHQNDRRTQLPTINELVGYCRAAALLA